ncbi:hypothetical protein ES703_119261 [subsurface metagenome]
MFQELAVPREGVAFPKMLTAPSRAHRPHAVLRLTNQTAEKPSVGRMSSSPAPAVEYIPGRFRAAFAQPVDEIEKRFMAFREIR